MLLQSISIFSFPIPINCKHLFYETWKDHYLSRIIPASELCRHRTRTQNCGTYETETWHSVLCDVLNREKIVLLYKKLANQSQTANYKIKSIKKKQSKRYIQIRASEESPGDIIGSRGMTWKQAVSENAMEFLIWNSICGFCSNP